MGRGRIRLIETAPDDDLVPLIGYYQPLSDSHLFENSQLGSVIVKGFGGAVQAADRLAARSRVDAFWFVLRGSRNDPDG